MISLLILSIAVTITSGCDRNNMDESLESAHQDRTIETALSYDSDQPMGFRVDRVVQSAELPYKDISYSSPRGGRVTAYLVSPVGDGPFAGLIFLHWGQSDRSEFLEEALQMAQKGVVCLLLNAPWHNPGFNGENPDYTVEQTVTDIRRGVDVLIQYTEVDTNRLGYVGHSYGATWGGLLASIEKRFKAFVLMAGYAKPSVYYPEGAPTPSSKYDPIHYLDRISAPLLFQLAENDEWVTREAAFEYYNACPEPKKIQWYDSGHEMNDLAQKDRIEWLKNRLDL